jgi:hypothetical protein
MTALTWLRLGRLWEAIREMEEERREADRTVRQRRLEESRERELLESPRVYPHRISTRGTSQ